MLITGGAGFIGTTLAGRLVDANEVIAIDNLHRDALSGTELSEHPNFRFVEGDVLDLPLLVDLARGCTHLVHAAGIAGVDTVVASPVRTMRVNVIGTYNALEAALATRDTLERLVEFSTSEVFGQHAFNVQEAQVTTLGSVGEARWTYAVSKLAGEHMAHAYHSELGVPAVSVRPFNIYGPGQDPGNPYCGVVAKFIESLFAGKAPIIHGDGNQTRDFTFIDDAVDATILAATAERALGEVFNVGTGVETRVNELAALLIKLTGAASQPSHTDRRDVDNIRRRVVNIEKTRRLLRVEIADQIVTDRVINELMGKDASARFRFIMDRAEDAQELDV